jgi:hypothetical protein
MTMRAHYLRAEEITEEGTWRNEVEKPRVGSEWVAIREEASGVHTGWTTVSLWAFDKIDDERQICKYCTTTKDGQMCTGAFGI